MASTENLPWRKPKRCESNGCVETAVTDDRVYVRNSTRPDGAVVEFTHEEWDTFLQDIRDDAAA